MSEHMPRYVRGKAAYKAHLWDTEDTFRLVGLHIAAVIQPLQLIRRFLFYIGRARRGKRSNSERSGASNWGALLKNAQELSQLAANIDHYAVAVPLTPQNVADQSKLPLDLPEATCGILTKCQISKV